MDKSYHHGDLRQALLDEAARILKQEGEAGLSMRKLATNIGVSRTAAYHYFANKEELLCAVAEEGFRRFDSILAQIPNAAPNLDEQLKPNEGQTLLRVFVDRYIDFAISHAQYYDLMFGGQLWKSTQLTESLKAQSHASFKAYVSKVKQWQDQGLVDKDVNALQFAQVSWSALHGMSRLMIDGIYIDSKSKDSMGAALVAMLL